MQQGKSLLSLGSVARLSILYLYDFSFFVICYVLGLILWPCPVLQRGGNPVEVFGLLAPVPDEDKDSNRGGSSDEHAENEAPTLPDSPGSVRSALSLASDRNDSAAPQGKRSRIPTLGRAGLVDRTNVS